MKIAYVHSIGPQPEMTCYGDEIPVWVVGLMTENHDCIKEYTCHSREKAIALGDTIARDRHVEHVCECGLA